MHTNKTVGKLPDGIQIFFYGFADAAHSYHNMSSIRIAIIFKKSIMGSKQRIDAGYLLFYNAGQGIIKGIGGLPRLKENVGVLGRTVNSAMGRV